MIWNNKMHVLLVAVFLAMAGAQTTDDPLLSSDNFGIPPITRQPLPETPAKPTEGGSTFVDDGDCQCVPFYHCDANNVLTPDERFGSSCGESVEVCCAIPKDASGVPEPQPRPDPTKVMGCGYRNPHGVGVTGGTASLPLSDSDSQFSEFPWMVALLDSRNSTYAGAGVLIHPQVVMTVAHTAKKYGPGDLRIRAGEWDTQTVKEIFPYEERNVQTTVIHENFMPKTLKNNIALLLLDKPLVLSEHINVICMPDQEEVFDSSKNCVANGWGKDRFGRSGSYAVILKKVELDMMPDNSCSTLLKRTRLGANFKLHKSFVCAGGEAGKDACQGDSGAALACPIGNNRYKLSGLVAWGIGCGQQDVPAVYTNVPIFRQWVDDKLVDWGLEVASYRISH